MADAIVLPLSGVVLTPNEHNGKWFARGTPLRFMVIGASFRADSFGVSVTFPSRDEALAWLDVEALALRSALLPADAVDRVARALYDHLATQEGVAFIATAFPWDTMTTEQRGYQIAQARAVLAALGIEEVRNG